MTQHFIDKPIQLKQCRRCNGYVFLCTDAGTQVACDVKPLSVDEYRQCIIDRRVTCDVVTQAGRPYMLRMRGVASSWPPYAGRTVVAEHMCTRSINMTGVDLIDPPATARASDTSERGANKGSCALGSLGTQSLGNHVNYATLHHSECESCGKRVKFDEPHVGIEQGGKFIWVQHLECE
jgi:hypothetical protein